MSRYVTSASVFQEPNILQPLSDIFTLSQIPDPFFFQPQTLIKGFYMPCASMHPLLVDVNRVHVSHLKP